MGWMGGAIGMRIKIDLCARNHRSRPTSRLLPHETHTPHTARMPPPPPAASHVAPRAETVAAELLRLRQRHLFVAPVHSGGQLAHGLSCVGEWGQGVGGSESRRVRWRSG